jgi:hypothetical protein
LAAIMAAAMNNSGIGVQQVPTRGATDWQNSHHPPDRRKGGEHPKEMPAPEPPRPPPAPGTGRLVDRTA